MVVKMDIKKRMKDEHGLTLIEILIGIVITALMMGAMYTSYNVVNKTYNQVSDKAKISKTSRDLVSMLMRDIRMAGYKYYVGSYAIEKFAELTDDKCTNGIVLPKTSYFPFENGYDDESKSHNPIVIRKKLLGNNNITPDVPLKGPQSDRAQRWTEYNAALITKLSTDMCCDQIEIVYEDFNINDLLQPFKKYRITYFAEKTGTVEEPSYGVYKSLEYWHQPYEKDCIWPSTYSDGWITDKLDDDGNRICPECLKRELIRDNVVDMEFIPFDEYGVVIKSKTSGEYPRPEPEGGDISIRDRLFDIRGVDIRLTFTTKDNFFTRTPRNKRKPLELLSDRKASTNTTTTGTGTANTNNTIAAGATGDLKLRDSVVVTVYARNIGKDLFQ